MSDVEYEWAVVHSDNGRCMRIYATEGQARAFSATWENLTGRRDEVHVARRPLIEWERVS